MATNGQQGQVQQQTGQQEETPLPQGATIKRGSDQELIPANYYAAVLQSYGGVSQSLLYPDKQRLRWVFALTQPGFEEVELSAWANYYPSGNYSPKSTIYQYAQALTGGTELDAIAFDDLLGQPCMLHVEVTTNQEGSQRNKVAAVMPAQTAAPAPPPVAAPAPTPLVPPQAGPHPPAQAQPLSEPPPIAPVFDANGQPIPPQVAPPPVAQGDPYGDK